MAEAPFPILITFQNMILDEKTRLLCTEARIHFRTSFVYLLFWFRFVRNIQNILQYSTHTTHSMGIVFDYIFIGLMYPNKRCVHTHEGTKQKNVYLQTNR